MKRNENIRQAFIQSAIRVVARVGLDKTTTKAIAADAGLNEAYIYRCFESKEDCCGRPFIWQTSTLRPSFARIFST